MCPVCIATAAIIAGSATGTGGLSAFVVAKIMKRNPANDSPNRSTQKEVAHGNEHDGNEAS